MSKRHHLTLLTLCETRAEMTRALPDDGVFAARHRVLLPRWRSWLNCVAALPGRGPLQVAYYRSAEFRARVAELLSQHDAAFAHLIRVAGYLDRRAGKPAILDMTDAISMNYARVAASGGSARGLIYRIERPRLFRYEREIARRFESTVLCSPVDRDFLFPPPAPGNILVCGNGVDVARVRFSPPESSPSPSPSPAGVAVFIGNMATLQNRDAAWWFCRRVLPLLRRQNAAWEFTVIGPVSARERAQFNRLPGVTATGYVEDVAAEVTRARAGGGVVVGVCPVRAAAGVQNKILDYMAMGLPCVTTAIGAEGLRARDGEELWVADSAQEFAAAIAGLAADPALARRVAINARRYVEAAHSWAANLAPLLARLAQFKPAETSS